MNMLFVCAAILLRLCWSLSSVEGVEFLFRGESIPTDGSGRLMITDISLHNGSISTSDEEALICRSSRDVSDLRTNAGVWYTDPEVKTTNSTASGEIITGRNDQGWATEISYVNIMGVLYRAVRLKRVSNTPVEGKCTCHILNDINSYKSLLILYPIISVEAGVEVDSEGQFRVKCTSTGGRVLNMSITGPHGVALPLSSIQPVGTQRWMGNDSYSATSRLSGVEDGDTFNCTASNGLSMANDSVEIRVFNKPVIESLERISLTGVRVEWSQPPGGARVSGYVVFYNDGSVTRNQTAPATATSAIITGLSNTVSYTVSVIALSEQPDILPGRSTWKNMTLWSPEGVVVGVSESGSVRVSWQAVEDADYYTVSFSQAVGDGQEGLQCSNYSSSVTVNDLTASFAVEEDVGSDEISLLRAYTTYSVIVVAFSDVWGKTVGSEATTFITPQRGSAGAPSNVSATALSSSVISVQWSGLSPCRLVNGAIVKYRVQYGAESGGLVESREVTGNWRSGPETELTGLTPSTNYSIAVAAVNEEGTVGAYSYPIVVETLPGHRFPSEVSQDGAIIIGTVISILGVVIAAGGIFIACLLYASRPSAGEKTSQSEMTGVSTEGNEAYGVSLGLPYEDSVIIQSSVVEEPVYDQTPS